MEIRHLRYFLAVAREQSFSRAAERLNMAQPPLSRQIRQLEAEFGADLFDRNSRPLKLTEAGRALHQHAVHVVSGFDQMRTIVTRYSNASASRLFNIGFVGSVIYGKLPQVVRRFRAEIGPGAQIALIEMPTLDQIVALREGRIDAGFGRLRVEERTVGRIVIAEERLIAAVPFDHPIAAGKDPVNLATLARYPVILYPRPTRPSYADHVLSLFHDHNLTPGNYLEVGELQTALGMVAAGAGISIVPASVQSLHRDDLAYKPVAEGSAVSPIILSHRYDDASVELQLLTAISREIYGTDRN